MNDTVEASAAPWEASCIESWHLLVLLVVLALAPLPGAPLYEPDEGRYAEIGREMLASGDWLTPKLNGELHLAKPPFAYWMVAVGTSIFGRNEMGARFMAGLAYLGTCLLVMQLGRLLYDRRTGVLAGLIYGTTVLIFVMGHLVSADVFLSFWQAAGVTAAVAAWRAPAERGRKIAWLVWASFGMAFFTKGPPALLPVVALMLVGWQRKRQGQPRVVFKVGGLLLFLVLALWWFVALALKDPSRWHYFLVDEIWNRVFTGVHRRENSRLIFLAGLTLGALPWALAYGPLWQSMRTWAGTRPRTATFEALLMVGWVLPCLMVFCLARSRLVMYVAPLFIPLAVAFARVLAQKERPPLLMRSWRGLLIWCVFLVVGGHVVRMVHTGPDMGICAREILRDAGEGEILVLNGTRRTSGTLAYKLGLGEPMKRVEAVRLARLKNIRELSQPATTSDGRRRHAYLVVTTRSLTVMPALEKAKTLLYSGRKLTLFKVPARQGQTR